MHRIKNKLKLIFSTALKLARKSLRPVRKNYLRSKHLTTRAFKLLTSKKERLLRQYKIQAHAAMDKEDWATAREVFVEIIDNFGADTPIEDRADLCTVYQKMGKYSLAEELLGESISLYSKANNTERFNQDILSKWLALTNVKANVSIRKRLANIPEYQSAIERYVSAKNKRSKKDKRKVKIAVYTAITGGFDTIKLPEKLNDNIDYIVFSDSELTSSGIFEVRPTPYIDADPRRSARFAKTNPHKLLPDYDVVVWVDANIMITGDIGKIIDNVMNSKKPIGAMRHPARLSVYEEMDMCIRGNKDDISAILDQKKQYKSEDYDCDNLIESNVLVFDLRQKKVHNFLNDWWNQIDKYSKRDQLSINYCLDKNNIDWHPFTDRPNSSRNHPELALTHHGDTISSLHELIHKINVKLINPYADTTDYKRVKNNRIDNYKDKKVSVVLCVHNALKEVDRCLKSIKKHKTDNLNLIIVDDGSREDTAELLNEFHNKHKSWTTLLRNEKAQGYTRAANKGMKELKGDLVILLNSDTVVSKDWHLKMADAVFSSPGAGVVGPMSSAASTQSLPDFRSTKDQTAINELPPGLTAEDMNNYCEKWSSAELTPYVPLVHGFCFGVTRELLDSIGYFDEENFPRGYGEENDYCFRAANAGFSLVVATHTYIYHEKSKSFAGEERKNLMNAGARAFRDKHGQSRITRAVKTMNDNMILQNLRRKADALYAVQYLRHSPQKNKVELIPFTEPDLKTLLPGETSDCLTQANKQLIDWKKLANKKTVKQSKKTSIIILVLNNLEMTTRCIDSVMGAKTSLKSEQEILVVSNGSDFTTTRGLLEYKEKYPEIRFIFVEQNLNFALGNNIGFAQAKGDAVVFLNNDTIVTNYWLDGLITPLEDKSIVAVQPALLYTDGAIQSMGVVFSPKNELGHALYAHKSFKGARAKSKKLQAATAACVAFRSKDFAKEKGFDPLFINGQEDVDLCLRLTTNSKDSYCLVNAESIVYHDESKTPGRGKNVFYNRRNFLERWSGRVEADALQIYGDDGYRVTEWKADRFAAQKQKIAIYTPKLKKVLFK